MHFVYRVLGFLLMFFMSVSFALAHGSDASLEKQVGDYVIDIGYDPEEIVVGERVVFDFELWNADKTETISFSRVWTRLEREGRTILATGVGKPKFGPTSLLFEIPDSGEWKLYVRYEKDDSTLAESSFTLVVKEGEPCYFSTLPSVLIGAIAGFLTTSLVVAVVLRMRFKGHEPKRAIDIAS